MIIGHRNYRSYDEVMIKLPYDVFVIMVSDQFRCARYKCGISACKQSNLHCYDGFCTNLCCANDIVILTGPREQNKGIWVG